MLGLESSLARDARLFDIVSKTRAAEIRFAVNGSQLSKPMGD
jgi:hypothetical protein